MTARGIGHFARDGLTDRATRAENLDPPFRWHRFIHLHGRGGRNKGGVNSPVPARDRRLLPP